MKFTKMVQFSKLEWTSLMAVLIIFVFMSCSKESSDRLPMITIHSPFSGISVYNPDSVLVDAFINGDKQITSVKVVMENVDFIPVLKAFYYYPEATSFSLSFYYPVNDPNLKAGTYYLLIRVEDGTGYTNEYRQVKVMSTPLSGNRLLVITRHDLYSLDVNMEDASGNMQPVFQIEGDYADSEINQDNNLLYLAGKEAFNLRAYDLGSHKLLWEKEPYYFDPMHNPNCLYFDKNLFVTYRNTYIQGIKPSGPIMFSSVIEDQESAEEIFAFQDFLLVDMQKKNGSTTNMVLYNRGTGLEKQRVFTAFDVVAFHGSEDEKVLITANAQNSGALYEYNIATNYLYKLKSLETEIISSVSVNATRLIIGTSSGIILYNAITNSFTDLLPGTVAEKMLFDGEHSMLYIQAAQSIRVYRYPEMENQKTFPFSDSILNLHLQFYKKIQGNST